MKLREEKITDHNLAKLDAYVALLKRCEFLQSGIWLKFQEQCGHTPRLFCFEHEGQEIYFSAFESKLPLGKKYLYIPRGPLVEMENLWPELLIALSKFLKSEKFIFIRFEPDLSYQGQGARRVLDIQPSLSLRSRLDMDEKEMLAAMHQKTRYNIKLALKKKLAFNFDDRNHGEFLQLMSETANRDKFSSHPKNYYRAMLESGAARLATVRADGELLAAGIFAQFCDTMMYLHGASSSKKREYMAPYALHWEMMMYAKGQDLKYYDWHGIDDKKWPGFTRFKRGFGGDEISYPGTFDLVLDSYAYTGYTVVRGLRRLF